MTTIKLLWGMLWRGGAWGLLTGAILGIAFGTLFANTLFNLGLVEQSGGMPPTDFSSGLTELLTSFVAILGALIGGGVGLPMGWLIGAGNGVLISIMLGVFSTPTNTLRTNSGTIFVVSLLYTSIAYWVGFAAILSLATASNTPSRLFLLVVALVPALMAGIAAGFISRLLTRWYERVEIGD